MTSPEPLDERYWSEYGLRTPAEVEVFREYERQGAEPCACSHLRREHFLDARGCVHMAGHQSSAGAWQRQCPCGVFRPLEATETAPNATGRGLDAVGGDAA